MFDEEPDAPLHGECAAEIARLNAELEACAAALPGATYMDPPDGGNVTVSEQLQRMAKDAARYRWLRVHSTGPAEPWSTHSEPASLDAVVDEAIKAANVQAARREPIGEASRPKGDGRAAGCAASPYDLTRCPCCGHEATHHYAGCSKTR